MSRNVLIFVPASFQKQSGKFSRTCPGNVLICFRLISRVPEGRSPKKGYIGGGGSGVPVVVLVLVVPRVGSGTGGPGGD